MSDDLVPIPYKSPGASDKTSYQQPNDNVDQGKSKESDTSLEGNKRKRVNQIQDMTSPSKARIQARVRHNQRLRDIVGQCRKLCSTGETIRQSFEQLKRCRKLQLADIKAQIEEVNKIKFSIITNSDLTIEMGNTQAVDGATLGLKDLDREERDLAYMELTYAEGTSEVYNFIRSYVTSSLKVEEVNQIIDQMELESENASSEDDE